MCAHGEYHALEKNVNEVTCEVSFWLIIEKWEIHQLETYWRALWAGPSLSSPWSITLSQADQTSHLPHTIL